MHSNSTDCITVLRGSATAAVPDTAESKTAPPTSQSLSRSRTFYSAPTAA